MTATAGTRRGASAIALRPVSWISPRARIVKRFDGIRSTHQERSSPSHRQRVGGHERSMREMRFPTRAPGPGAAGSAAPARTWPGLAPARRLQQCACSRCSARPGAPPGRSRRPAVEACARRRHARSAGPARLATERSNGSPIIWCTSACRRATAPHGRPPGNPHAAVDRRPGDSSVTDPGHAGGFDLRRLRHPHRRTNCRRDRSPAVSRRHWTGRSALRSHGLTGARTTDLPRQLELCLADTPDLVVILIGGNDLRDMVPPWRSAAQLGARRAA